MNKSARKLRDVYAVKAGAPLFHKEFGYYCMDAWHAQGLPENADLAAIFHYDSRGDFCLTGLGGCTAELFPCFEEKVIEDKGDTEIVQDSAGRHVLYFKGRRNGFMPEYVDHPVKDMKSWEEKIKWRMNSQTPGRLEDMRNRIELARPAAENELMIRQYMVGGYMYLRSLIGPESLLYAFYDMPELIHECMKSWLELADKVTAFYQKYLSFDELLLDEDICYNNGALISPEMILEFLIPYYQQLITNVRSRQIDKNRQLYIHLASDGFVDPLIPLYTEKIGLNVMSPFEVASGSDVVRIGQDFPDLVISGGIDKRILAAGKDAIDKELERILPPMIARGGYIPTCDHGVPEEVSLENYMHYRERCMEYSPLLV
ncbi:MAG: hypothetical protein A2020_06725 [Lentisphaerae bacterium GWF2_45_14]|nr:MAG: hypothetical protein A2020_06725 [Lentisphaerae bacterium GWF2_45_14]